MRKPMKRSCMYGGADTISVADLTAGYDVFRDALLQDIDYVEGPVGGAGASMGNLTDLDGFTTALGGILPDPIPATTVAGIQFKFTEAAIQTAAESALAPGVADIDVTILNTKYDTFLDALVKDKGYIDIDITATPAWANATALASAAAGAAGTTVSFADIADVPFKFTKDAIEAAFDAVPGPAAAAAPLLPPSGAPAAATSVTYVTPNPPTYDSSSPSMNIEFKVGVNIYKGTIPNFTTKKITPVPRIVGIGTTLISMKDKADKIVEQLKNIVPNTYKPTHTPVSIKPSTSYDNAQAFVDALAQVLYDCAVLNAVNTSMQENVTVRGTTITIKAGSLLNISNITVPASAANFDKDVKVLNALKAALLKLQAKSLTDLAEMIAELTEKAGGKSKDSKHRRFKGGFQELDVAKMYNAQGLVTDLDATLSQHLITNANSIPGPFSAGGLTQSSEGIDANLGASIKADVVPSYNGGSKKNKSSRRK